MDTLRQSPSVTSISASSLAQPGHPRREALQVASKIAVIAAALAVVLHVLLAQVNLLHYPSAFDLLDSAVIATMIASALCYGITLSLTQEIADITQSRDAFALLSNTDLLSGLPNRRAFEGKLAEKPVQASLALIDIDLFKRVNDNHGHMIGDQVLCSVARRLRDALGPEQFIARAGGEEFAVIATGTSAEARLNKLTSLLAAIEQTPFDTPVGALTITVSMGVAELDGLRSRADVLSAADRALYAAKNAGRNRIIHETALPARDAATLVPSQDERRLFRAGPVQPTNSRLT